MRIPRILPAFLLLALSLPSSADDDALYYDVPPPGKLIDLGGYRLHMNCQGTGSPTVILEAGLGDWSSHWAAVQKLVRNDTRVCSYDRAGYGWSDPGPRPRDSQHIVSELHALLEKADIAPPYILVGHSFGGLTVRLFASTYRGEVAGLVLVDASHPESLPYRRNESGDGPSLAQANQMMVIRPIEAEALAVPPEAEPAINDNLLRTKSRATARGEYRALGMSVLEIEQAPPFGDLPLVVISRGKREWPAGEEGDAKERDWQAEQQQLGKLSRLGSTIVAAHSGHHIQIDEPDVVAGAIRSMLRDSRLESAALLR